MTKNLDCSNDIEICLPLFDGQDFYLFFPFKTGFKSLDYNWGVD